MVEVSQIVLDYSNSPSKALSTKSQNFKVQKEFFLNFSVFVFSLQNTFFKLSCFFVHSSCFYYDFSGVGICVNEFSHFLKCLFGFLQQLKKTI